MKQNRSRNHTSGKSSVRFLLISAIVVLCVVCIILVVQQDNTVFVPLAENSDESTTPSSGTPGVTSDGSIAIPGYESIQLTADTTKQAVSMMNPAENNCIFIITLYLPDGTLLWESDEIKPGKASEPIKLTTPLASGVYEQCIVHYSCYDMDKKRTPLNNAEIKLSLIVN